jgi:hypothetical protein
MIDLQVEEVWVSTILPLNPMFTTIMLRLKGNLMNCRKLATQRPNDE